MTLRNKAMLGLAVLALAGAASPDPAPRHITGIGGVFIKAKDPRALAAWYRDVLGLPLQASPALAQCSELIGTYALRLRPRGVVACEDSWRP